MKSRFGLTALTVMTFAVLLGGGFVVQQHLTTSAFDKLEAKQVAEHAERVRVALEYELQLAKNYGATNSIWDDSYDAVDSGDQGAMTSAFVPADLHNLYGLDAVLGVGIDGSLRTGGFAAGTDEFAEAPEPLRDPALLKTLFDPNGEAGSESCGMIRAGEAYLYCGFPTYRSDSTGPVVGGLVYLKSLDAQGLAGLSTRSNLALALTRPTGTAKGRDTKLESALGEISVRTTPQSENRIALDLSIPAKNSADPVVMRVLRDRPIHQQAGKTSIQLFALVGTLGFSLLFIVLVVQSKVVMARVRRLRKTVEGVTTSEDRSLRVDIGGGDEIGQLASSFNEMLEQLSIQASELQASQAARERSQQIAEEMVQSTSGKVVEQLAEVVGDTDVVRNAAGSIDDRVAAATLMTHQAGERAQRADEVVDALGESTARIGRLTSVINKIAGQTHLLALNATIEAARAGAAGKGFAVVANEVKELADLTASSTSDIDATIETIRHDTDAVTQVMREIVAAIDGITGATRDIAEATGEQRATVDALSQQLNDAIARVEALTHRGNAEKRFGVAEGRPVSSPK